MPVNLLAFEDFAAHVTTATRDEGVIRLQRLMGTQQFMNREITAGLERGVRQFLFLKGGRQVGGSTCLDLWTLWWLQQHLGMVGEMVSDDDANMKYRRKVLRQMLRSLPKPYRFPTNADNLDFLELYDPRDPSMMSTLVFDYAGIRNNGNLGRSKGLNYLYADEVGSWQDEKAVEALRAALSEHHPDRLYFWISTARGFNVFKSMWDEAAHAVSTRRVFVPWWRHEGYRIEEDDPRYAKYAGRLTADERLWVREVKREYDVDIDPEQVIWRRWKLAEEMLGDETMMEQEYGNLPDSCFVAFGDKFISVSTIQRLRLDLKHAPKPAGYRYEVGQHWDESQTLPAPADKAPLLVWEEPEPLAAYIVAGHPWGSSSQNATQWVAHVFRAWPDQLVQCAEYTAEEGTTYGFAWLLMYLCGAYNTAQQPYLIVEANGPGYAVMNQIKLFREQGYGLSTAARQRGLQDFGACFRHYFYARPDNLTWRSAPIDWKTNPDIRPYLLHSLADTVIRGHMTIRSAALINSLAGLRRGESGDNDQIQGGAGKSDAHAVCAALAVKTWQDFAMSDLQMRVAPKQLEKSQPTTVQHAIVSQFMTRLLQTGRTR
jgi:hypothetical protein